MGAAPPYMDRRHETMLVIPTTLKTLNRAASVPAGEETTCAQPARPTFGGWGPTI